MADTWFRTHPEVALCCWTVVQALWSLQMVLPRKPGLSRLIWAAPNILLPLAIPPALFSRHAVQQPDPPRAIMFMLSYLMLGLNATKVLSLSFHRGPLAGMAGASRWKFLGAAMMPVVIVLVRTEQGYVLTVNGSLYRSPVAKLVNRDRCIGTAVIALVRGLAYWLLACVRHATLNPARVPWMPSAVVKVARYWPVQETIMVLSTWLCLSWTMDAFSAMAALIFDIQSLKSFNNPFTAGSLSEFWRCRWNILVSTTLRPLFYDPIIDESQFLKLAGMQLQPGVPLHLSNPSDILELLNNSKLGRKQREALAAASRALERDRGPKRGMAVLATFVGCGALHEMIFWFANGRLTPGLRWLAFFSLQAVGILLQRAMELSASSIITMFMNDSGMLQEYPNLAYYLSRGADWLATVCFLVPCIHWLWLPGCHMSPHTCFIP